MSSRGAGILLALVPFASAATCTLTITATITKSTWDAGTPVMTTSGAASVSAVAWSYSGTTQTAGTVAFSADFSNFVKTIVPEWADASALAFTTADFYTAGTTDSTMKIVAQATDDDCEYYAITERNTALSTLQSTILKDVFEKFLCGGMGSSSGNTANLMCNSAAAADTATWAQCPLDTRIASNSAFTPTLGLQAASGVVNLIDVWADLNCGSLCPTVTAISASIDASSFSSTSTTASSCSDSDSAPVASSLFGIFMAMAVAVL